MAKVVVNWLSVDTLFIIEPVAWTGALLFVMLPYLFSFMKKLKVEDKVYE